MSKYLIVVILFSIILSFNILPSFAQTKSLSIGAEVPDMEFSKLFNSKTDKIKLSDYKGKLIVLDFWNVYCIPCIEAFPKLDSLQNEFKDKMQIIPVTELGNDSVAKFFKNHFHVHLPNLPFITGAKFLDTLFLHTGVPFEVWIKDGKVLQFAEMYNLNAKNIRSVVDSGIVNFNSKIPHIYVQTLIDKRWTDMLEYGTFILRYNHTKGLKISTPDKGKAIEQEGSILDLYMIAYANDPKYEKDELNMPFGHILEVQDPSKYSTNLHGDDWVRWMDNNGYYYDLIVPDNYAYDLHEQMRIDLDRYFHLHSAVKKRMVDTYVLIRMDKTDKLKTRGGDPKDNNFFSGQFWGYHQIWKTPRYYYLQNKPFGILSETVKSFVEYNLNMPFMDATLYHGNIDIKIIGRVLENGSLEDWRAELQKYGLDLIKKSCYRNVLVLSDNEKK